MKKINLFQIYERLELFIRLSFSCRLQLLVEIELSILTPSFGQIERTFRNEIVHNAPLREVSNEMMNKIARILTTSIANKVKLIPI